ncbi:hypothetical protein X757_09185 [Mesorhizobium sp. LSHC414A00]|nr:ribosomal protein L7/L12 [Mesorhizobium sp. LSHC414A00]ESX78497.1 hypothetical protein X757_09185 [Mesorhizobium sp. LSHC414A00]
MNMHVGASKFKVGQRVRCVDGEFAADELATGETYKIAGFNSGDLRLEGVKSSWSARRFLSAPLFAVGDKVRAVRTSYSNAYIAGNTYIVKSAGDNHISTERDEHGSRTNGWGADNFEPAYTSCAAAEVDNLADEYGSPKPTKSEFKVGDRVRYNGKSKEYHMPKHIGTVGTVARSEGSGLTTTVDWDVVGPARTVYTENIELAPLAATLRIEAGRYYKTRDGRKVGPASRFDFGDGYPFEVGDSYWVSESGKAQTGSAGPDLIAEWSDEVAVSSVADSVSKPSIVCLIENGQPKPSTLPFVHADKDLAATEAARLAGKHPGQEFGVYELVTTRREAKVYPFTWQNKATQGLKIDAIKEVRAITGLGLKAAKDAVESWLASEAA